MHTWGGGCFFKGGGAEHLSFLPLINPALLITILVLKITFIKFKNYWQLTCTEQKRKSSWIDKLKTALILKLTY